MRRGITLALIAGGFALLLASFWPRPNAGQETAPETTVILQHPAPEDRSQRADSGPTTPEPSVLEAPILPTTTVPVTPQELARTDQQEQSQPLTRLLPHDTPHFTVDYTLNPDRSLTLKITLKAVLNRPDQRLAYEASLRAYKAEALAWLSAQGVDTGRTAITWLPPDAAGL